MTMPLITRALVMSQDPDNGAVFVMLLGTGSIIGVPAPNDITTAIPIRCLFQGPADNFRLDLNPLPQPGQYGLVCFPLGDIRSGIWLGSYIPTAADALPGERGDPDAAFLKYFASFSGYWNYLDINGKTTCQYPDNSSLVVGEDAVIPTIYRDEVDADEKRIQTEFTMEDRVSEPPDLPLEMQYTHGSSTTIAADPQGNLFVLGGTGTDLLDRALDAPAALDVEFGGTIFAIGPADPATIGDSIPPTLDAISVEASGGIASTAGDMNMLGNLDPPASWTVKFAGALIQIDHEGNIIFNAAPGGSIIFNSSTFAAITTGAINIISGGDAQTSIDGRNFVLHTHIGVQTGAGISGPVV